MNIYRAINYSHTFHVDLDELHRINQMHFCVFIHNFSKFVELGGFIIIIKTVTSFEKTR